MTTNTEEITPVELDRFLNGMNTLFYLFVCIPLLCFVVVYLKLQKEGGFGKEFEQGEILWHYALALLGVCFFLPGEFLYRKQVGSIKKGLNFKEKLVGFKRASLLKYTLISAGCTIIVLFLYLISTKVFLVAFGFLLVLFSLR